MPLQTGKSPGVDFIHPKIYSYGSLCNYWDSIGCLAAQLSHLSITLRLGVAENAAFPISYGIELRNRIQRMERRRDPGVDFGKYLSEENDEVNRYLTSLDLGKGRGAKPGATTFDAFRKKSNNHKGSGPNGAPKGNGKIIRREQQRGDYSLGT